MNKSKWKLFRGDTLPQNALDWAGDKDIFNYNGSWCIGLTYYLGDSPETATDWIITTDNGWAYKVNAIVVVWYRVAGQIVGTARWSKYQTKKALDAIREGKQPDIDPDYQT
jgi:hypothetical protein